MLKSWQVFKSIQWYIFLIPLFVGMGMFFIYPLGWSLRLSFYRTNTISERWVGLANYIYVLRDPIFLNAFFNTVYMLIIQIVITISIALLLANSINKCVFAKSSIKAIYLLPFLTSFVIAAIIWIYVYDPDRGPLSWILNSIGVHGVRWLSDPSTSKISVVIFSSWHELGYAIIIYLAGLQTIPPELYAAAKIDGANSRQLFFYITIPLLKPATIFLFMTQAIFLMRRFNSVYLFGSETGAPARSIQTLVPYIYEQGFSSFCFGTASAAVWVLFISIIGISIVNIKLLVFRKE